MASANYPMFLVGMFVFVNLLGLSVPVASPTATALMAVMNFFGRRVGHTKLAFQEHLEIVETIRSPRPGALGKAVEHHILAVGRRVSEFVREKQGDGISTDIE